MTVHIRPETSNDCAAIHDVTRRAFAPMPYSDGDEPKLIDRLRRSGDLAISLVAEHGLDIVGHIAFSPAYAADQSSGWYALGPVAVEPSHQQQAIGSRLIKKGIELLQQRDAAGCILVGNPDYYQRFGFRLYPDLAPMGQLAEFFMILPLRIRKPEMVIQFHPLFQG